MHSESSSKQVEQRTPGAQGTPCSDMPISSWWPNIYPRKQYFENCYSGVIPNFQTQPCETPHQEPKSNISKETDDQKASKMMCDLSWGLCIFESWKGSCHGFCISRHLFTISCPPPFRSCLAWPRVCSKQKSTEPRQPRRWLPSCCQ